MKILFIGAHQDDNEFDCGGLAMTYIDRGHEVRFLSVCNGCGGHHILSPEETTATRAKESAAVAEYLGITYDVWDFDDCSIVPDLETRRRLIRYIRAFAPDLIVSHRPNDYHADHRTVGQLVQDASYMLIVPHECPDVPAMRKTPVILYSGDYFTNPPFRPDFVFDITPYIERKMHIASLNVSQVFEWLPYTNGETVPEGEAERLAFLRGTEIDENSTDKEVLAAYPTRYVKFAKPAAKCRKELIKKYGRRGRKIRFAEMYQLCEYSGAITDEVRKELLV
ncbi:MAG: PIG-L family deacetylase [Clostridia bacterium]|nr:PIG-L family deacetylase [Clostridia bacterium]